MEGKGVLLHDYFDICGGGERLALILSHGLDLDLCFGFWTEESYDPSSADGLRTLDLGAFSRIPGWRTVKQMRAFRRRTRFLKDYDLAVYSGVGAPLAVNNHRHGANVFYCHSPPRFIYDQRDYYEQMLPGWQQAALTTLVEYVRPQYESAVAKMDHIVANSENVRRRIRHYLGRESEVVYPPVETERFRWLGQGDYYLSTARLDALKRVDTIIRAFKLLPAHRLVVASGGAELPRLRELARGTTNITITGWVSEPSLRDLVGNARATIYIPRDEDFGMSPVESMAAGKPVIGVASGGLLETVVDGSTGFLLPPDPHPEELCDAVDRMDAKTALAMRRPCEQRASLFSSTRFIERMDQVLDAAVKQHPLAA